MNVSAEFFPWTQAIGWTLIHSLWQGLIVCALISLLIKWIPTRYSSMRYSIACAGLGCILLLSLSTLLYLNAEASKPSVGNHNAIAYYSVQESPKMKDTSLSLMSITDEVKAAIQPNMDFILLLWCAGTLIFTLRMASGWWYISRLQTEALPLQDEWSELLQKLAGQLNIKRVVTLAQSSRIHAPLVIGFLKPIVLIPSGMVAGLSTEQIETIFVHELAHIRRHDYIINLLQTFIEALFFFNPFVWILSGIIRREREYCCDDAVLMKGSPLAYARALARLEEERLSKAMFALSLAENKNQLLNRIKRIMEKSAKNYSGKDRLVPALLLIVGLICASWLTIGTDRPATIHVKEPATSVLAPDTVIKKLDKAKRSKTTIITYDETGTPHENVIEEYEGDGDFDMDDMNFSFDMPGVPSFPAFPAMPEFPSIQAFSGMPAMEPVPGVSPVPDIAFSMPPFPVMPGVPGVEPLEFSYGSFGFDTIPGGFHFRSGEDWEEFSKAFEEKFKEQFGDFYKTHEKDFEKMMKELEKNFEAGFNADEIRFQDQEWARASQEMARVNEKIAQSQHSAHADQARHAEELRKEAVEHQQELNQQIKESMEKRSEELRALAEDMKAREQEMRITESKMKVFQEDLKELLVKDGYMDKEEKIRNINWDDDGEIEINGKKIKEKDRQKYNDLHDKHFKTERFR
jgi:bla regulator protein BlaR1